VGSFSLLFSAQGGLTLFYKKHPELNLIERYWKHLKELACANKLHDSIDDVVASAEYMMTQQNDPASAFRLAFSKLL
jgi:hypothetical protein